MQPARPDNRASRFRPQLQHNCSAGPWRLGPRHHHTDVVCTCETRSPSDELQISLVEECGLDFIRADITCSPLYTEPAEDVDDFADQLDSGTTDILDRHCPLTERKRFVSSRRDNHWLSTEAVDLKKRSRRLERKWRSTRASLTTTSPTVSRVVPPTRSSLLHGDDITTIASSPLQPTRVDVGHYT